jgi:murein DD-endopeptidase MepM/ murein hydrolase activator NlpD
MIHLGVDINNLPDGQDVANVREGVVVFTEVDETKFNGWGGRVIVKCDNIYYMYGHLQDLQVKKGDRVAP